MLTTKEREAADVPTPADGHATLFVDAGTLSVKRDDGTAEQVGAPAASWSAIISAAGSHLLTAGPLVINRFRCDLNSGVILLMPVDPTDGTIVNIKEVSGNPSNTVQVSANGSGSIEDYNGGFSQPVTLSGPAGISISYQYDLDDTSWRMIRYYQPDIGS